MNDRLPGKLSCGYAGHLTGTLEVFIKHYGLQEEYDENLMSAVPCDPAIYKGKQDEQDLEVFVKREFLSYYPQLNAQCRLNAAALTLYKNVSAAALTRDTRLSKKHLHTLSEITVKKPSLLQSFKNEILSLSIFGTNLNNRAFGNLNGMTAVKDNMRKQGVISGNLAIEMNDRPWNPT